MTIVTHHAPDLDALASVWLIKRFLPNWQDADVVFVPAGETLEHETVDSDPHILHVDTGLGLLDHHQSNEDICASQKTYAFIKKQISKDDTWQDEALERIADVVNYYDHFREVKLPDISADYHVFDGINIIDGLKSLYPEDDGRIVEIGLMMLDAIYKVMQEKIWAEENMKEGIRFSTMWGNGIGFETVNDAVLKTAQKTGFVVVIRKDPKKKYVRIKGMPDTKVDFTSLYEKLRRLDPSATWYLHPSKKILLNGTTKNPDMKPTKLTLSEIIKVLEKD